MFLQRSKDQRLRLALKLHDEIEQHGAGPVVQDGLIHEKERLPLVFAAAIHDKADTAQGIETICAASCGAIPDSVCATACCGIESIGNNS